MKSKLQVQEAVERLKILDVSPDIIDAFKKNGAVHKSENGFVFPLDEDEQQIVEEWEQEFGYLVYHVIDAITGFGEMLVLMYVSAEKENEVWKDERERLKSKGYCDVYAKNLAIDAYSEFGTIKVQPSIHDGVVIAT